MTMYSSLQESTLPNPNLGCSTCALCAKAGLLAIYCIVTKDKTIRGEVFQLSPCPFLKTRSLASDLIIYEADSSSHRLGGCDSRSADSRALHRGAAVARCCFRFRRQGSALCH